MTLLTSNGASGWRSGSGMSLVLCILVSSLRWPGPLQVACESCGRAGRTVV